MGQVMVLIILFNAPTMFITLITIFQVKFKLVMPIWPNVLITLNMIDIPLLYLIKATTWPNPIWFIIPQSWSTVLCFLTMFDSLAEAVE